MNELDKIFKAYDVRGLYPGQVNEQVAYLIGRAYAAALKPKKVAVGRDVRASGEKLKPELIRGLIESGVDVIDIGVITTDQLYFAVGNYGYGGGISVTASHNPSEYNGFKFAEAGGAPLGSEQLEAIKDWVLAKHQATVANKQGVASKKEIIEDYVEHLLSYVDAGKIKPYNILANANFGAVGRGVDILADRLGLKLEHLNWEQDGTFPKGPPNPLLPENRAEMSEALKKGAYDLGVAWDADADRCFLFAGDGTFIPSCYIIALLSEEVLKKQPGAKIIYDLTTSWPIKQSIESAGGVAIANRTGHTFIKRRMREESAVFAGESSGHYYFKKSFYADNGIVPLLLVMQLMSRGDKSLEELVAPLMQEFKVSGEINFEIANPQKIITVIEHELGTGAKIDRTDGVVIETKDWRMSVRSSNTEPLMRLNAESRSQDKLDRLIERVQEIIRQNS
ncbi:MAG TPA: phosphomannomutase/phosphoglucomutase [Candidatus Saccharimonadales bacterium]|nr:phosphomannomutase/phosphoglucomutase [Candidatus Saccharimonadales bacterium]